MYIYQSHSVIGVAVFLICANIKFYVDLDLYILEMFNSVESKPECSQTGRCRNEKKKKTFISTLDVDLSLKNVRMAYCECHFPIGILGQVWYLIVLNPDLCTFTYFKSLHAGKLLIIVVVCW